MSTWRLAIDFGTSNSAAAICLDGRDPQAVRLTDSGDIMPSAVFVDAGGLTVGNEATRRMLLDPSAFERNPKRLVGQKVVQLGGTDREVVDLVAAVLRTVTQRAARVAGGGMPTELTLTYPAGYQRARRDVLVEAAERAGFSRSAIGLLPEPVAAVARYAQHASLPAGGSHLCVLDVGGGTTDVAVLRVTGDARKPFEVVSTAGRPDLGGGLFDLRLENIVLEAVRAGGHTDVLTALESGTGLGARRALREQVSQAKHALSESESTTVPVVTPGASATVTVTASEFAEAIADDVEQITALTVEACSRAGLKPNELATVYLTGGASLVRPLQTSIARVVGQPAATLDDPKLITCLGALSPLGRQLREPAIAPMPAPPVDQTRTLPQAPPPQAAPPPQVPTSPATYLQHPPPGPAMPPVKKKRRKKVVIGAVAGGLVIVGAGVAGAYAVFGSEGGGDPDPTRTTSAEDFDCTDESPDLSDGECGLLNDVVREGWPIDTSDCYGLDDPVDAQVAIYCYPLSSGDSTFVPGRVDIYGYGDADTMDAAFADQIEYYDLQGPETLDAEPGWSTWHYKDEEEDAGSVLLYYSEDNERSAVAWTDRASRAEMWAWVDDEHLADLYAWWEAA